MIKTPARSLSALGAALLVTILFAACGGERKTSAEPPSAIETATEKVQDLGARLTGRIASRDMTQEEIAQQRHDERWRQLESFRKTPPPSVQPASQAPAVEVRFQPALGETYPEKLEGLNWGAIAQMPVTVPVRGSAEGPSVLRAQVLLDRNNYSPGVIDGRWGKNSEIAVWWFQRENGMEATGELTKDVYQLLASRSGGGELLSRYAVTAADLQGPFTKISEDVYEQAKLDCLCYESIGELLAEKFHTTIETLSMLNGGRDVQTVRAGATLFVPNVQEPPSQSKDLARLLVSVEGNYFHGYDAAGRLVLHAPTTVGSEYDPSPTETLKVAGIAFDPTFHYQPKLFADVPDEEPETMLQAGPNSPVGKVWMALSKENYGIHGTKDPGSIGYAASHGCIRLTNWTALQVARRTPNGTKVEFTDAR
jgi:lipoprotein-anchoring transpeptidase ErfK/SrfK